LITYSDIPFCLKHIRILVLHQNRVSRDEEIGYVNIDLSTLQNGSKGEDWLPIHPFQSQDKDASLGSIRLSVLLKVKNIISFLSTLSLLLHIIILSHQYDDIIMIMPFVTL